jgi:GT2 family glycosyltransferase
MAKEQSPVSQMRNEPIPAIIPTFAGEARLEETLDRLSELVVPSGFALAIYVVDNFGRDRTEQVFKSWAERHPEVQTHYMHQPLAGMMNALQMAVDAVDATWVIMLDDDVSLHENWLTAALFAVNGRGRVGFCAGPIELAAEENVEAWMRPLLSMFAIYDLGNETIELIDRQLAGAAVLIRREAWQQSIPRICRLTGRTKGSLVAGNDIESQRSMQRHGWFGLYVPGMRLTHRVDRRRFQRAIVARQSFAVGLEKCFHRMAGLSSFAALFILPGSVLWDWPQCVLRLLKLPKDDAWVFQRNYILGQMVSPFYFVWHRIRSGLRRIQHTRMSKIG